MNIKNVFKSEAYNKFSILIIIISIILGGFKTIKVTNLDDKILYGIFTLALILILPDYLLSKKIEENNRRCVINEQ